MNSAEEKKLSETERAELEAKASRLAEEITEELAKDPTVFDRIEESIAEFRKKHPYK